MFKLPASTALAVVLAVAPVMAEESFIESLPDNWMRLVHRHRRMIHPTRRNERDLAFVAFMAVVAVFVFYVIWT